QIAPGARTPLLIPPSRTQPPESHSRLTHLTLTSTSHPPSPNPTSHKMRFAATILATLLAASAVVAQDPPACLGICSTAQPQNCADAQDPNAATKCACEDKTYIANSTACLEVTCPSAKEFATAQQFASIVCAQQGVSLEPSGTWKGPDATQTTTTSGTAPTQTGSQDNAALRAVPAAAALLASFALALAL
ncbi:hypothetical protein AURDEDRAFT_111415, partial [Auricularia subglabra TFB-10046 SS5]